MFAKSLWNRLCPTLRLIYISGVISSRCHPSGSIGKRSDDKETSGYSLKHNTWRICIFLLLSLFILVVNIISVHTWTSCPCAHKHIYFRSSPLFFYHFICTWMCPEGACSLPFLFFSFHTKEIRTAVAPRLSDYPCNCPQSPTHFIYFCL